MLLLFIIAIFCIPALFLGLRIQELDRRKEEMSQLAQNMDLDFLERDSIGLKRMVPDIILQETSFSQFYNILPGILESIQVYLFDYSASHYVTRRGHLFKGHYYWLNPTYRSRNLENLKQTMFVAFFSADKLSDFRIQADGWFQAFLIGHQRAGWGPITEYRPEKAPPYASEEDAWNDLPPELQVLLLGRCAANIEFIKGWLIVYRPEILMDAEDAQIFYLECCALTTLLKDHPKKVLKWAEKRGEDY